MATACWSSCKGTPSVLCTAASAAWPQRTFTATPIFSSHRSTSFYEAYVADQKNLGVYKKLYTIRGVKMQDFNIRRISPVCHMNKKINHTAGQVAHKSNLSCVVRPTNIAMEAYNNSHQFNMSTG